MRKAEGGGFQQAIATPWTGIQRAVQRTWLNQEEGAKTSSAEGLVMSSAGAGLMAGGGKMTPNGGNQKSSTEGTGIDLNDQNHGQMTDFLLFKPKMRTK